MAIFMVFCAYIDWGFKYTAIIVVYATMLAGACSWFYAGIAVRFFYVGYQAKYGN